MNKYDAELCVLSCLLIKPSLMEELKVEDKHFVKHQRIWNFMKAFYKKFKTFDIGLMYSICSNKYHLVNYLEQLLDIVVDYWNFDKYQDALIEDVEKSKKDKWIIKEVYKLANDLYVSNIKVDEFQNKIQEIYNNADKIFEKV